MLSPKSLGFAKSMALSIRNKLTSEEYCHDFVSRVFQYKIGKVHEFVSIFRIFFRCLLCDRIKLCCSPQYGTALWSDILGFFTTPDNILLERPEIFFEDYVSETTTFIRFHTDYYYNYIFDDKFRLKFARNCIKELLKVASEHNQIDLVFHCIIHTIQLQRFK